MTKSKRNGIKHALAMALLCLVMSMGMICLADEKGTVKVASAKIRASADASSEQLGSVAQGGNVDIIGETTGADGKVWYQVFVDANTKGYIRADLVDKKGGSSSTQTQSATDQTPTNTTAIEAKKGTVVTNNVRIRKGASTNHDVVATANRGMVVTVTGEADGADGKKWFQISFTYNNKEITGFIRSDLVTFENVPADTAVSEITGEENSETEAATEEPATEQQQPQEPQQPANESQNIILMNVEEVPYIMPGFVAVDLNWNDQKINAYKNGNFYIFYAQKQNGEEDWYLFDSEKGVYQRYAYTAAGAVVPDDKGGSIGMFPLIMLSILVVILAAAVVLLVLKLKGNTGYNGGYGGDEEDDDDEDIEDLEDISDDDEEEIVQPVRRPQPQRPTGQPPVRRPQPQEGEPVRRPQGQRPTGHPPVRRPQPQEGEPVRRPQGQRPTGQQPVRRPQPQNGEMAGASRPQRPQGQRPTGQGQPVRRPNPQGGNPSPNRRPQPQNESVQMQKGYKAKNLLENDDDMDFMDL